MRRRTRALAAVAVSSLGAFAAGCSSAPPPSAPNEMLAHEVAFDLPSDKGELGHVPPKGARATVVDFFGPTCGPCKKSLPALVAKKRDIQAAGAGFVLVAVLADSESNDDAARALSSWGVPGLPFLVDRAGAARIEAGVTGLPATLVLDGRGSLRWSAPDGASADDVVAAAKRAAKP
jgi:thiol-disulfide isomerase/thioredoxin